MLGINTLMGTPYASESAVAGQPQHCTFDNDTQQRQCGEQTSAGKTNVNPSVAIELTTADMLGLPKFNLGTVQNATVSKAAVASVVSSLTVRPFKLTVGSTRV